MMPKFKTILYCTQMGPDAPRIFRHACVMARAFGAKINVLHVHETLRPDQEGMVEGYAGKGSLTSVVEREERAEEIELHQRIHDFFAEDIGKEEWEDMVGEVIVAEGKAGDQILLHVEKTKADVVVMGSHRYSLLEVLIGTTTHSVIAKGRVPVLVVPIFNEE